MLFDKELSNRLSPSILRDETRNQPRKLGDARMAWVRARAAPAARSPIDRGLSEGAPRVVTVIESARGHVFWVEDDWPPYHRLLVQRKSAHEMCYSPSKLRLTHGARMRGLDMDDDVVGPGLERLFELQRQNESVFQADRSAAPGDCVYPTVHPVSLHPVDARGPGPLNSAFFYPHPWFVMLSPAPSRRRLSPSLSPLRATARFTATSSPTGSWP
jgi:hypothetical protein